MEVEIKKKKRKGDEDSKGWCAIEAEKKEEMRVPNSNPFLVEGRFELWRPGTRFEGSKGQSSSPAIKCVC